jgi:hypothetical protein
MVITVFDARAGGLKANSSDNTARAGKTNRRFRNEVWEWVVFMLSGFFWKMVAVFQHKNLRLKKNSRSEFFAYTRKRVCFNVPVEAGSGMRLPRQSKPSN